MSNLIKTTVTIPEDIIDLAKLKALQEKTTLSALIRSALEDRIGIKQGKTVKDPMKLLGTLTIGINKIYGKRSDLYKDHSDRKMGI